MLLTTLVLLVGGAVLFGALEWSNPATLGALPVEYRPLNALFESVTLRSGGFAVVDHGALGEAALFVAMALMFIGGASGSTAGGIKVNTFSVLLVAIVSTVRGRPSAEAFGRRMPDSCSTGRSRSRCSRSRSSSSSRSASRSSAGTPFVDTTFESISAFGTVGLTTGITPTLPDGARLLVAVAMFVGRLGPLTLVLALAARRAVAPLPAGRRNDADRLMPDDPLGGANDEAVGSRHRPRAVRHRGRARADGDSATTSSPSIVTRLGSTRSRRT